MVATLPLAGYAPTLVAVSWLEMAIITVTIALRLYTRYSITRGGLGWDDAAIVCSWVLFLINVASLTAACAYGFGRPFQSVSRSQTEISLVMALISRTVTVLGIITSKSAIALFLLRIVAKKWQKWILWITIGTTAIICIITVFVSWFACQPISHAWSPFSQGTCSINTTTPLFVSSVWSVIVDFFLAGLPWVVLYPLNLRKTQNLNIAVSLSMGAIAGILGIVRSWAIDWDQENETDARTAAAVMWAFAEFVLSTITASIPSLWPLYRSLRGHPRASGSGPSGSHPSEEDEEFAETARKRRRFWSRPNQSVKEIANDPDEMALSPNLSDKPLPSPPSDTSIEAGRVNSMESILREQRKYGVHTKDISVSSKADSAWEHADYRTAPG